MSTSPYTNLIIPGAAKSGTTSLHEYLALHPEICMSEIKEPHFFSIDRQFQQGTDYYNGIYSKNKPKAKWYGESSTSYLHYYESHSRIKKNIPNARFVVILRNPIDRLYSHYTWLYNLAYEDKPLKEAILTDADSKFNPNISINGCYKYYVGSSLYGNSFESLFNLFDKSRFHVITFERFQKNSGEVLEAIFNFLEVNPTAIKEKIDTNKTKDIVRVEQPSIIKYGKKLFSSSLKKKVKKRVDPLLQKYFGKTPVHEPLNKESRLWLKSYFKEDVDKLKRITGKDFAEWRDFND